MIMLKKYICKMHLKISSDCVLLSKYRYKYSNLNISHIQIRQNVSLYMYLDTYIEILSNIVYVYVYIYIYIYILRNRRISHKVIDEAGFFFDLRLVGNNSIHLFRLIDQLFGTQYGYTAFFHFGGIR